jgi:hypothetical protein
MEQRETYIRLVREAVDKQDVDAVVRLLEDAEFPYWLRREGSEIAMESTDDEFAVTAFNRLFLPIDKAIRGETLLLLEWWLKREVRVAATRRLTYLRAFLREAAGFADLPDRLYEAVLAVLAIWTQQANSLAGWSEAHRITALFLATYVETAPSRLVDPRILRAALWSGDLGLMKAFADVGVKAAETPEQRLMLHYIVGNLVTFSDITALRPLAEALYERDSHHPLAIHNLAEVYAAECRDAADIASLYLRIDEQLDPNQFRSTVNWMGQVCYNRGYKDIAARLFAMLPAGPANGSQDVSWPQKVLQDKFSAAAAEGPPVDAGLLDLQDLPPILAQPLEQAARLAQGDMTWSAALTAEALEYEFRGIIERISAIPRTAPFLADFERAVHRMVKLSREYFEPYQYFIDVSPVPPAEKYGRMDMERLRIAYVGLNSIAASVAAMGLESILDGTPLRSMDRCLRLLDYYVGARLALGAPDEGLALLERFQPVELCRDFVRGLAEKCLLVKGKTSAAEALLTPDEQRRSVIYGITDRKRWSLAENLAWDIVVDDQQCHGQFEVTWTDGSVSSYDHSVPRVRLAMTRPGILTLRRGEILRGRRDLIVRPERAHYPCGYPDNIPDIVARGDRAVRLLRLPPPCKIAEPVVVLENFDALYHRNYYHWVVLLLARVNHVKTLGLIEGRRLVVPEGLSAWMQQSCRAIGVSADDILIAQSDVELRLTDALLISSVEFASPTLLRSLCTTLLTPAVDEKEEPLHLYISRRDQTRRPLLNEPEIEAIARDLGFTIVLPETLPFIEQARLFRRADSVAGPEGAAFANTIFCKPGTRILGMLSENDLYPTYNDLATIMGLKHRKLTGKAELDDYGVNYLWAPYRIDPKLAKRDLCWSRDA